MRRLSNAVTAGHPALLSAWNVASPNWGVVLVWNTHWILKTLYEKEECKRSQYSSYTDYMLNDNLLGMFN